MNGMGVPLIAQLCLAFGMAGLFWPKNFWPSSTCSCSPGLPATAPCAPTASRPSFWPCCFFLGSGHDRTEDSAPGPFRNLVPTFEKLHCALVLLCGFARLERPQVAASAGLGILFAG